MDSYRIDFLRPVHVYFCGIGGVSMSGLAQLLLDAGFCISGSDARKSEFTDRLEQMGARISYGQRAENVTKDMDVFVYTAAIREDNPEFMQAVTLGIPMLTRASLLGQLMTNYRVAIAVGGTHGKTSTTSMLSYILMKAKTDPTISVGGNLDLIQGNFRIGGREIFLTEACEYTNSFLEFHPTIEVILNIEADHLDFFKDLADIRNSFRRFVSLLPADGKLLISSEIEDFEEIMDNFSGRLVRIGFSDADLMAKNIRFDAQGFGGFDLYLKKTCYQELRQLLAESLQEEGDFYVIPEIKLSVVGKHNIANALAAIGAGLECGLEMGHILQGIKEYRGVGRRFEVKGQLAGNITIVDDYAHHPQEIEATLRAAAEFPHKKLWCIFQPHTYTRTKAFLSEFSRALLLADHVILADIYAAREKDTLGVSAEDIVSGINAISPGKALYVGDFDAITAYLRENLSGGDLCITMGAGDIDRVAKLLLDTQ